ncbi:MAG: UDP-glucose 4-epimerase GalE [Bacillus subtilis]|nr:UDP-glucose 4-epimerase GalE [Bacillus subtilis]
MNVLVLGGAGYIGSHFVKAAIGAGHRVIVVDNLQTGHRAAIDPTATFYEGDIRDRIFINNVFDNETIDACVHFAANSLVGESVEQPLKYFDNNVRGTISLLEAMQSHGVKKIVFSSSAAVYGSHQIMPITEDYPTVPMNPYGQSKLMMEQIMKWCDGAYGIKFVSLRYFNVAGAWFDGSIGEDHRPETHLIPIILQVPLGKRPHVTIFGNDYQTPDGTCIRDYIHVVDLADAHLRAIAFLDQFNRSEVFNLGSQDGYSNLEILETARAVSKEAIPATIGPRRAGDPDKLIASNQKAKRLLGWEPKRDIRAIVEDAWNYHRRNPQGYGGEES